MVWESVMIALESLRVNKLRSILTMLGIIIGVGAVVAMVAIGLGVREKVKNSIAGLGSNLLIVTPGGTAPSGARLAPGTGTRLTLDDVRAIQREVDGAVHVIPSVQRQYQLVVGNQNWTTSVEGSSPEWLPVRNFEVVSGAFFTTQDIDTRARVAVIGQTVAKNLFGEVNPVGLSVRVDKAPFQVVGVLGAKGQSAGGQDQDDVVVIPVTTAMQRLQGITYINRISIQAESEQMINQVQNDVTQLLRSRHRLSASMADDFTVRNLAALMEAALETTNTITLLLGNIAAISLLVGGIGIMNIMLVSVTERTREIGIRKALGATYKSILLQFLIESIVIGVVGGSLGILLGIGASYLISYFSEWQTYIAPWSMILAFSFSVTIGLIFGIYPARKAALLDPIEALRYE